MIKAIIFDLYETLITLFESKTYFGNDIAFDLKLDTRVFRKLWDLEDDAYAKGHISFEELLSKIMNDNNCYSEDKHLEIISKRYASKRECYKHLNSEIIPMLKELKKRNIKIGLISNCYSEEAILFRESSLASYFDVIMLSSEQGIIKPNQEIFMRCLEELQVKVNECMYIGDGGSNELSAARDYGMMPFQALWYLKDGTTQPVKRLTEFEGFSKPLDILEYLGKQEEYPIRLLKKTEYSVLNDFLYEAIYIPEGVEKPAKTIIERPELQVYVKDFGESDDYALVALDKNRIIGAVWSRIMLDYGHIKDDVPSLAISLFPEYRGKGIGTRLLRKMLSLLEEKGYPAVSLSVQKENYAYKMYLKAGFKIIDENTEEYIMECSFSK